MRRFLASAWYPFLVCLVLAGATAAAFAMLAPTGDDVGNGEIVRWAGFAAWLIGPVAGLLTFLKIGILNLVRRIVRIRKVRWLHPVVVLLGTVSTGVFAWILAGEPPFTPIARAVVAFGARPLLWGSLVSSLLAAVLALPIFFQRRK